MKNKSVSLVFWVSLVICTIFVAFGAIFTKHTKTHAKHYYIYCATFFLVLFIAGLVILFVVVCMFLFEIRKHYIR